MRQHTYAAAFACLIVAPLAWMGVDRAPPVERLSGRMMPAQPRPGEAVTVEWITNIARVCPGTVSRTIVDGEGKIHTLDNEPSTYSAGTTLRRTFLIPSSAAPGPAKYRARVTWACNPLHYWWPIVSEGPEVAFMIADPKASR